jgi:hypothetical protein
MEDFFSLDDDKPVSDEESSSLHRNCLKELALEQMQYSDDSDAGSDISEDLPEGTDWNSLPAVHKKHDRNVNEVRDTVFFPRLPVPPHVSPCVAGSAHDHAARSCGTPSQRAHGSRRSFRHRRANTRETY